MNDLYQLFFEYENKLIHEKESFLDLIHKQSPAVYKKLTDFIGAANSASDDDFVYLLENSVQEIYLSENSPLAQGDVVGAY